MTYIGTTDYWFETVARGADSALSFVNKFGENPDISTTAEDVWGGGGDYTGHDAVAAETVDIFSSDATDNQAGVGARSIQLYGLDGSYVEQSETLDLHPTDGTIAVTSSNTYLRLFRAVIRAAGSSGANAGSVTVRQTTTTANVFAVIQIGYNQTTIAAYTIPASKAGYLLSWRGSLTKKTSSAANMQLLYRPENEVFQVKDVVGLTTAGTSQFQHVESFPSGPIAAKTDIKVRADCSSSSGVAAGFHIVLVAS